MGRDKILVILTNQACSACIAARGDGWYPKTGGHDISGLSLDLSTFKELLKKDFKSIYGIHVENFDCKSFKCVMCIDEFFLEDDECVQIRFSRETSFSDKLKVVKNKTIEIKQSDENNFTDFVSTYVPPSILTYQFYYPETIVSDLGEWKAGCDDHDYQSYMVVNGIKTEYRNINGKYMWVGISNHRDIIRLHFSEFIQKINSDEIKIKQTERTIKI